MKRIAYLLAGGVAAGLLSVVAAQAAGLAGAPAPFDKGGVKIAVVNFIGGGDWLQAFEAGAKRQADALGIDLRISEARQDPDAERQLIEQAINLKVDGLIINNGKPEALKDVAQKAVDAGIKVVAYDVNLDNPKIAQIEQSDHDMARLVLEQAVKDQGDGVKGGVVYVAGFAPLDRRYEVWKEFGKAHGVTEEAVWGVVNDSVAASVADQTKAVLRAHPDIKVDLHPLGRIRPRRETRDRRARRRRQDQDLRGRHLDLRHPGDRRAEQSVGGDRRDQRRRRRRSVGARRRARHRRPGPRPFGAGQAVAGDAGRACRQQDRHHRRSGGEDSGVPRERRGHGPVDSGAEIGHRTGDAGSPLLLLAPPFFR